MTNTSKNAPNKAAPQKNGLLIGLIAALGVVIALLLVIVVLLLGRNGDSAEDEVPKRNVVVNEDNLEQALKDLAPEQYVDPGSFQATMNSTWHFPDGSSPSSDAYVENVINNTRDIYFDVMLADTEEIILESPIIPRGSYMKAITLDKDLDPGTYDCVLVYHLIDGEQRTIGTVSMAITIIVEG